MSFSVYLYENPAKSNNKIGSLTPLFTRWMHSHRSIGGCYQADGEIPLLTQNSRRGASLAAMKEFFITGVGQRIMVHAGGMDRWDGQIVRMEYTRRGRTYVRTMEDVANQVKLVYTRVGDNLLTNGDVESGAWTQYGTPSTHETVTDWFARGPTAMHVVSDDADEGTVVESGVTITANLAYVCSVVVEVVSGDWTLIVDDGAGSVIASQNAAGTGREWLKCQIPDSNTTTSVRVLLSCAATGAEIYADGAILQTAPVKSETTWYQDEDSINEFGRIEAVFLEGEMTDDEADTKAQLYLAENAWVRTVGPESGSSEGGEGGDTRLVVSCMGLFWTLTWRNALTSGADQASDHISALLDESEFIASSDAIVRSNSTEVLIEATRPTTIWRAMEKVVEAGDGATPWMGGVYPNYEFRYEARPDEIWYRDQGGRLEHYSGGNVNPIEALPGWCFMADMPYEPPPVDAGDTEDPRRIWLEEMRFVYEFGKGERVDWSRK